MDAAGVLLSPYLAAPRCGAASRRARSARASNWSARDASSSARPNPSRRSTSATARRSRPSPRRPAMANSNAAVVIAVDNDAAADEPVARGAPPEPAHGRGAALRRGRAAVGRRARRRACPRAPMSPASCASCSGSTPTRGVNLVQVAGKWIVPHGRRPLVPARRARRSSSSACRAPRWRRWRSSPTTSRSPAPRSRRSAASLTSRGTLDVLLETGWIRMRGRRRAPGRPVTYGTTEAFLSHFGLDTRRRPARASTN